MTEDDIIQTLTARFGREPTSAEVDAECRMRAPSCIAFREHTPGRDCDHCCYDCCDCQEER